MTKMSIENIKFILSMLAYYFVGEYHIGDYNLIFFCHINFYTIQIITLLLRSIIRFNCLYIAIHNHTLIFLPWNDYEWQLIYLR